ncbi:hypothetical protein FIBSPDRAFT_856966 [Athelia psychrophila]|uniref:Uncharacterized protein n=1 Tax=Athelia psychrophila TaxID=1759441 RepID=A0A166MV61_9AGAM|nr:hypothetical protein FIBSPDRAFT_856966 [Fibularhizoctonia sp. CBS 109695]
MAFCAMEACFFATEVALDPGADDDDRIPIRSTPLLPFQLHRITPPLSQSLCATTPATTPAVVFTPPSLSLPMLVSRRARTALCVASPESRTRTATISANSESKAVSKMQEGTPQSHE